MNLTWKSISIGQFLEAHKIATDESYTDPLDKEIGLLSAVTGKPEDYFLSLPGDKLKEAALSISFLNSLDTINTKLPKRVYLKGRVYDVTYQVDKLSGGQYIDISSFMKGGDVLGNLHNLMAVICVPRRFLFFRGKYNGKGHAARANLFKESMNITVAYSVTLFFCNLWQNLVRLTPVYSTPEATTKQSPTASAHNGAG